MMSDEPLLAVVGETARILKQATAKGAIGYEIPQATTDLLVNNVFKFSGFKSYQSLANANLLLLDDKGDIKPFSTFKKEVKAIDAKYNVNYLQTEWGFAVSAAQSAGQWAEVEADGDEYDLQYRTAADERVRASHAVLNDTTLSASDPFWSQFYPPNGWNCRCKAVKVRKGKYPTSDSEDSIQKGERATTQIGKDGANKAAMFRFNPGQSKTIFPDRHPYYKVSEQARPNIVKAAKKALQQSQTFDDEINKAKNIREVEKALKAQLEKEHEGINISLKGVRLDVAKRYAQELKSLAGEYQIDSKFVEFKTTTRKKNNLGYVEARGNKKTMFVGEMVDAARTNETASHKSLCDKDKLQVSTLNHEFAHILWCDFDTNHKAIVFKDKIKKIYEEYHSKLLQVSNEQDWGEYSKVYIGRYGSQRDPKSSLNEFVAEGFQEFRNKSNPSDFAQKVGTLIDETYKKR